MGISITNKTSLHQIKYLLNNMQDETCVILIFHSLSENKVCINDRWCWNSTAFESLCEFVRDNKIITLRNADLF